MDTNRRIGLLRKIVESGKFSHAYLFSGNDEAEQNRASLVLLETLGISRADRTDIAPKEDGSTEIPIAKIRSAHEFLSVSPWNSPYKAVVIQKADRMNREAQSAFLKLLEEPKGQAILLLQTAYPDLLLSTIRSRAQELKFYSFASGVEELEGNKEFKKVQQADLFDRFIYAKQLAETPEHISQTLGAWIKALRHTMMQYAKTNPRTAKECAQKIKIAQEVDRALQATNTNPRLALERLMLEL